MIKWLSDVLWTDSLWLAPGFKWTDVKNSPGGKVVYPESRDFYYQIPLVVGLIVLRFFLEKHCFEPVGLAIGIRDKKKRMVQHIPLLEAAYCRSVQNKDVTKASKSAKLDRLGKLLFMVFTPIWFYTRLYLFSLYLYSISVRGPEIVGIYFAGFVLAIMAYSLFALSVYWSLLILRVLYIYNYLALGVERDVRSSSSEVSDDSAAGPSCSSG